MCWRLGLCQACKMGIKIIAYLRGLLRRSNKLMHWACLHRRYRTVTHAPGVSLICSSQKPGHSPWLLTNGFYVLEINPLSGICVLHIFSPSMNYLFIFLIVSFDKKLLIVNEVCFISLSLYCSFVLFGSQFKKTMMRIVSCVSFQKFHCSTHCV